MPKSKHRNKFLVIVGQRIREKRRLLGLTQQELSIKSGFKPHYLGFVERGETSLGFLELIRLCEVLGLGISELIQEVERNQKTLDYE